MNDIFKLLDVVIAKCLEANPPLHFDEIGLPREFFDEFEKRMSLHRNISNYPNQHYYYRGILIHPIDRT